MPPGIERQAFSPKAGCPSLEELSAAADGSAAPQAAAAIARHAAACANCGAEIELLRSFLRAETKPDEVADVDYVAARMRESLRLASGGRVNARRRSWRTVFSLPSLRMASLACACMLLLAAGITHLRQTRRPELGFTGGGNLVERSGVVLLAPLGDTTQPPAKLEWRAYPGAASYKAEIVEVDRTVVFAWRGDSTSTPVPQSVRALMSPGRTLRWQVAAFDPGGKKISASGLQPFRVAPQGDPQ